MSAVAHALRQKRLALINRPRRFPPPTETQLLQFDQSPTLDRIDAMIRAGLARLSQGNSAWSELMNARTAPKSLGSPRKALAHHVIVDDHMAKPR